MKRDCSTCICKEGSCYPSTTIFDKDKTCKSYAPDYEDYIEELEKENAELRVENALCEKACEGADMMFKDIQKAKKLLNEFLDFEASCMERGIYISDKTRTEAEQFIGEVENETKRRML